jgi:MutS-like protein
VKAFLLHRERDFELERDLPPNEQALVQDLGLDPIFGAMAAGDDHLLNVARRVVLSSLHEPEEIVYRQHVLQDCIDRPEIAKVIYDIALGAIEAERRIWHSFLDSPDLLLHRSLEALELLVGSLKKLRRVADGHATEFRSEGFRAFFEMTRRDLGDEYLATVEDQLRQLRFPQGALISARLGKGNKVVDQVLRKPHVTTTSWWQGLRRWLPFQQVSPFTLVIAPRDEAGFRALADLRGRGIGAVASALAQSAEHIVSFFSMIRFEVGFYLACLNLREELIAKHEPLCFPVAEPPGTSILTSRALYDVGLSLRVPRRLVGNDVEANGKRLVMITGANQGGKSTFLRSVGLAQLMMQCGMFVGAASYRADVADGLFTHFKREEDVTMSGGKLDEELRRASEIADHVTPTSSVLFNESFAATNEREGAEIAQAIVRALLELGVKVFFVTHSYELARGLHERRSADALFLRAERRPDGQRTFRQIEGEPLPTSYGEDLYAQVFADRSS